MTDDELSELEECIRQTLREISRAIRTIAARPTIKEADEQDLRLIAASIDEAALTVPREGVGK